MVEQSVTVKTAPKRTKFAYADQRNVNLRRQVIAQGVWLMPLVLVHERFSFMPLGRCVRLAATSSRHGYTNEDF